MFWKQLSKLGLALEHSETKSEGLGKKANTNREVRRLHDLEEEVARLKMEAMQPQEKDRQDAVQGRRQINVLLVAFQDTSKPPRSKKGERRRRRQVARLDK